MEKTLHEETIQKYTFPICPEDDGDPSLCQGTVFFLMKGAGKRRGLGVGKLRKKNLPPSVF
jgi:hypothetical protein